MKIEIDYDGSRAICSITDTFGKNPGKMVQFSYADPKSQEMALGAFRCIREHYKREKEMFAR